MADTPLSHRVLQSLRSIGLGERPDHVLVAFSGGLDSAVLVHLLRLHSAELRLTLTAAHFDHRMRPGSEADATWVAERCDEWGVPLEAAVATRPIRNEAEARVARYTFLREAAARRSATFIATAHHADDQAETVLFRALRGAGLAGLRGIAARTRSGLIRPLLPFWREELVAYGEAEGLGWRSDPTNDTLGPARNRLRLRILPEIERGVAPGARRNLVELATLARESEAGWRALIRRLRPRVARRDGESIVVARAELRRYHRAVASRLVRDLLRRVGPSPGRAGTRLALKFITDAPSGREIQLPEGVRIRTEFALARIERDGPSLPDVPLRIERPEPERELTEELRLAGRTYHVTVRLGGWPEATVRPEGRRVALLPLSGLRFPLLLRGRQPGDRVRTPAGTKSLKKLMIERRVPRHERGRIPVLVDADDTVLWVGGLTPRPAAAPEPDALVLQITIVDG